MTCSPGLDRDVHARIKKIINNGKLFPGRMAGGCEGVDIKCAKYINYMFQHHVSRTFRKGEKSFKEFAEALQGFLELKSSARQIENVQPERNAIH